MKIHGAVPSFSQSVISQLGGLAMGLSPEELSGLRLAERSSIAALGAVRAWSNRQVAALVTERSLMTVRLFNEAELDFAYQLSVQRDYLDINSRFLSSSLHCLPPC